MTAAVPAGSEHGRFVRGSVVLVVAICLAIFAWAGALAGAKGMVGVLGITVFTTVMIVAPRRHETLLAIGIMSFGALMHKSFTGLAEISSGPPSLYVSSFDIIIFLLYFAWFLNGPYEMWAELREAFTRPIMYAPAVAGLFMVPGLLVAPNTELAGAEVVRMLVMYALFVYLAVRIRTRAEVWVVVGALLAVGLIEAVVVAGQYLTRSALGLSLFGTPSILHNRFDGIAVARPFGTMAHPVFMGAVMGPIALLAFCLAVNLRRPRSRLLFAAISAACVSPIVLASARSASLAIVVVFVMLVVVFLVTGRLEANVAGWSLLAAMTGGVLVSPYLIDLWNKSFKTEHFSLEWESRVELNRVAIDMIDDRLFFGHGLNNFEQVMDRYDRFGLIFDDNPVHNMYLLQIAETGIVGFVGVIVLIIALLRWSVRLARVRDRLYSSIGFAGVAALLFWGIEEFLVFSLRQDHPRSLFFIMAGLVVATARLAGVDRNRSRPVGVRFAPEPPRPAGVDEIAPAEPSGRPAGDLVLRSATAWIAIAALGGTAFVAADDGSGGPAAEPASVSATSAPSVTAPPTSGPAPTSSTTTSSTSSTSTTTTSSTTTSSTSTTSTTSTTVAPGPPVRDGELATVPADSLPRGVSVHEEGLEILVSGINRSTGRRGIYLADAVTNEFTKLTPDDDVDYSWPVWANNGTKILYTARSGAPGAPEALYWMDADGSNAEILLDLDVRLGQPKMSPDGRTIVFTAVVPGSTVTRILRWDLGTGDLANVSDEGGGILDSDPRFTPDGNELTFVDSFDTETGAARPGAVSLMSLDGSDRRVVVDNGQFDTDPDVSVDGQVVSARYIGDQENPLRPDAENPFQVTLVDFVLAMRDLSTGEESILTNGENCVQLVPTVFCVPTEGSSYLPRFTPDGQRIGYVTLLNSKVTCICVTATDRSDSRVLVSSSDLALSWFDWVVPGDAPPTAVLDPLPPRFIPAIVPVPLPETTEDALVSMVGADGHQVLSTSFGDATPTVIDLPPELEPREASWNASRDLIVFTATSDPAGFPERNGPSPPSGRVRAEHFTLEQLDFLRAPTGGSVDPSEQIYTVRPDGTGLRQLTTPWTEDWRDAIAPGDARAHVTPDLSPNGRYVVFTSQSSGSSESFIMRYDLVTGEVLSLTNATSGALPVRDRDPSWSNSGEGVAFVSDSSGSWEVWIMEADGHHARPVTSSNAVEQRPVWSPADDRLAFISTSTSGYTSLVVLDRQSGETRTIDLGGDVPVRVSWSPQGQQLGVIVLTDNRLDLTYVSVDGGDRTELETGANETWIDWG